MLESKCSDISKGISILYANDTVRHFIARVLILFGFTICGIGTIMELTPNYNIPDDTEPNTNNKENNHGGSKSE